MINRLKSIYTIFKYSWKLTQLGSISDLREVAIVTSTGIEQAIIIDLEYEGGTITTVMAIPYKISNEKLKMLFQIIATENDPIDIPPTIDDKLPEYLN